MNIRRILLLAGMALAAIAFAAPAAAQANVVLTDPANEPVPIGAEVTATSEDLITATAGGTIECEKVTLHFIVETNGNQHVMLDPQGETAFEGCVLNRVEQPHLPITVTDGTAITPLTLDTWGTGWTGLTSIWDIFADAEHKQLITTCHFIGLAHVQADTDEGDTITVDGTNPPLSGSGPGCPSEAEMEGTFTLETNTEPPTPVTIDFSDTTP